ncbi:MAG: 30S ribosomal protein S6 [Rickettsia sp.]|nr:30S ribosomal protein S6 [Rickettsia sp.]
MVDLVENSYFYELVVINRYDSSINENYSLVNSLKSFLEKNNLGFVKRKEFWGLLNFSYPINKYKKGHYIFFALSLKTKSTILSIQKHLNKIDSIVRTSVFKVNKISEEFSTLAKSSDYKNKNTNNYTSDSNNMSNNKSNNKNG